MRLFIMDESNFIVFFCFNLLLFIPLCKKYTILVSQLIIMLNVMDVFI